MIGSGMHKQQMNQDLVTGKSPLLDNNQHQNLGFPYEFLRLDENEEEWWKENRIEKSRQAVQI